MAISRPVQAGLLTVVAAYLAASLFGIATPGIEYDEGMFLARALEMRDTWRPHLVTAGWVGALKEYLWLPSTWWITPGPMLLRIPVVLMGLFSVLLFWRISLRLLPPPFALLATALFALDTNLIFQTKFDSAQVAPSMSLRVLFLWFTLQFRDRPNARSAAWAGLALGLGTYNKVTFLIFAAALGFALVVTEREMVKEWLTVHRRACRAGLLAALVGISPLLAFNVVQPLATLRTVEQRSELFKTQVHPDTLGRLAGKFRLLNDGLVGVVVPDEIVTGATIYDLDYFRSLSYEPPPSRTPRLGLLHFLCWISVVLLIVRTRGPPLARTLGVGLLTTLLMILMVRGTVYSHHVALLYPILPLAIAMAAYVLWQTHGHAVRAVLVCILGLQIAGSSAHTTESLARIETAEGRGPWSPLTLRLSDYLEKQGDRCVVAMDWGIRPTIQILSDNRIQITDELAHLWQRRIPDLYAPQTETLLLELLDGYEDCLFVFHGERYSKYDRVRPWWQNLNRGRQPIHLIREWDGEVLFEIYEGPAQ